MQIFILLLHIWSIHGWNRLRLQGGEGPCTGRVEVFHDNVWGIVCNHKWQKANDEVICRTLGCGVPRGSSTAYTIPNVPKLVWMNEVNCTGTESNLWDCTFPGWGVNKCPTEHHINIECSEKISLTLEYGCAGAVQYTTSKGKGAVCHANWGKKEADMVCRERNCGVSAYMPLAGTYRAEGPALISFLNCTGYEAFLWQCSPRFGSGEECADPVGVICSDYRALRLIGGSHSCSGKLELKVSGAWKPICQTDYRLPSAGELCSHLRCGDSGRLEPWTCNGMEQVNLTCSDTVKIVLLDSSGRESQCFGTVHVDKNGTRKAVCGEKQTRVVGEVVCRELGCGEFLSHSRDHESRVASGRLSRVQCQGTEANLWHCLARYDNRSLDWCQGASVICEENKMLYLLGDTPCSGKVGIQIATKIPGGNYWLAGSLETWKNDTATVVCQQTQCGSALSFKTVPRDDDSQEVWKSRYNCASKETSLFDCTPEANENNSEIAFVHCSGSKSVSLEEQYWGKLHVCVDESCGGVCADVWTQELSDMVCQQLGCGNALLFDGRKAPGTLFQSVHCAVPVQNLTQCSFIPTSNKTYCQQNPVYITCSGSIRAKLVHPRDRCAGNVEMFVSGSWYPVCKEALQKEDVREALCKDAGCGWNSTSSDSLYRPVSVRGISDIECTGNNTLKECQITTVPKDCVPGRLQCSGRVSMLLGEGSACKGRVFVLVEGSDEYPVAMENWGDPESKVLCRYLRCGEFIRHMGQQSLLPSWWMVSSRCLGNETSIWDCVTVGRANVTPTKRQQLHVECSETPILRLSGTDRCTGQVEIDIGGQSVGVCGQPWGEEESRVVCQELNCSHAIDHKIKRSQGIQGEANYVSCNGKESKLWQCGTKNDACKLGLVSVTCADDVQFNLTEKCGGEVKMYYWGEWQSVCPLPSPTSKEARLICAHLGCGDTIHGEESMQETERRDMRTSILCTGSEKFIRHCVKPASCTAQKPAFVYCEKYVKQKVNLTVDTGNPIVVPLLLIILVLVAALVIWLWIRRVRHLKTGMVVTGGDYENAVPDDNEMSNIGAMSTEVHELTTRVLPEVPESVVEVDVEARHGASSYSEYDDIEEEATDAARLLEEESATHEPREMMENMASATGGEAESQQDYDDVIEPPLVREPQWHRNYEDSSERILSGN